ncbi:MAG: MATE family efflux transporter, partial [Clostridia bacterium]|nr:MATE family efflux transporter [Clostridia bacterium]
MTEGNIRRKILRFALPILAGYFFQQLYNTVDALIVGNYLDADALAAVTSTASYTYLMIGFVAGFATGAGIISARHIGAGHRESTEKAVHTAVAVGLFLSVLLTAAGILFTPGILRLMETPESVFHRSCRYLQVYFAGAFALVMYNMSVSILQA